MKCDNIKICDLYSALKVIPHISEIEDGLGPGTMIRIQGTPPSTAQR